MARFYSLGGLHGHGDPRLVPLIIISLIALKRNVLAERIANWLPFCLSDRQLLWSTRLGMTAIYGVTCCLYALYASGAWTWAPGVVFTGVEIFRLLCTDVSQSVLGEPFDK